MNEATRNAAPAASGCAPREEAPREEAPREEAPREKAPREKAPREKAPRPGGLERLGPGALLVEAGRALLRTPAEGDRAEYLALRRESAAFHRPWEPSPPSGLDPYGDAAFDLFLAGSRCERRLRTLLCRRADARILGAINFNEVVRGPFQNALLGYWVGAPYAGQGYMREGLALALHVGFELLGLHRLEANIRPENEASIALVRGAGFRLEGYSPRYLEIDGDWRDHERWALVAEEWRAAQSARSARR